MRKKRPPFSKQLKDSAQEVHIYVGREEAWRRAKHHCFFGIKHALVWDVGVSAQSFSWPVAGRDVWVFVTAPLTKTQIKVFALILMREGAKRVLATSYISYQWLVFDAT